MSSNEEYLDNLLKTMSAGEENGENQSGTIEGLTEENPEGEAEPEEGEAEPEEENEMVLPEDTTDLSQSDIERLLEQALEESEKEKEEPEPEENDEEVNAINELLDKSDNNEAVSDDIAELLNKNEEENTGAESKNEDVQATDGKKKPGFFSRIFSFLTAEDEDEEEKEGELASNSEENKKILGELEAEDEKGTGKKKKKKKKNLKGDNEESGPEEGKESEEEQESGKKAKKDKKEKNKKAKKEKKEKKKKKGTENTENAEPAEPEKKVSKKKVVIIFIICFLIMAIILLSCIFLPRNADGKKAKRAFYKEEYRQCYQLLYGKDLNESEQIIFDKAKTLFSMERRWDSYQNFLLMGKELEALNSLIIAPGIYDRLYEKSVKLNILEELTEIYKKILNELDVKYHVSEKRARELSENPDKSGYRKELETIIEEKSDLPAEEDRSEEQEKPMEDVLPQEEEMEEFQFIQ